MASFNESYILYNEDYFLKNNIVLSQLGSDSVIIENKVTNEVYICGHFKELKVSKNVSYSKISVKEKIDIEGQDMKFINQMIVLNQIFELFIEKECYVMCDANTTVIQGTYSNTLIFCEKEGKMTTEGYIHNHISLEFTTPLYVENKTTDDMLAVNTTFKMRGTHTSQLNKSFIESIANIDYIIHKPKKEKPIVLVPFLYGLDNNGNLQTKEPPEKISTLNSFIYVLDDNKKLKIKSPNELTTSSISISDHSPVVTYINGMDICLGTFNIKGGNTEDSSWAEFLVEEYKSFFLEEVVQEKINDLLLTAFNSCDELKELTNDEKLKKINEKNFISKERFSICEVHLNPNYVPFLSNYGKDIHGSIWLEDTKIYTFYYHHTDNTKARYILTYEILWDSIEEKLMTPKLMNWLNVLLADLNQYNNKQTEEWNLENQNKRIKYFQERVIHLLNFYQIVQQNKTILVNNLSLYDIYLYWYLKNQEKVSIKNVLIELKEHNSLLKVVSLQEYPVDKELVASLTKELQEIGNVYLNPSPFIIDKKQSATQGAIFVFH